MKKIILIFLLFLLVSCSINNTKKKSLAEDTTDSISQGSTDIQGIDDMNNEIDTKSLEELENNLVYIENI